MTEAEYEARMMGYYPEVIRNIKEMQATVRTESFEIKSLNDAKQSTLDQFFIDGLTEEEVERWEKLLGNYVFPGDELENRKLQIKLRLQDKPKLTGEYINSLSNRLFHSNATTIYDPTTGTLEIKILGKPMPGFPLGAFNQIIARRKPAHIYTKLSFTG